MRFVDLFAGIGGFHYAISDVLKEKSIKSEFVMASEIDKFAKETYSLNHGVDINDIKDIREYTNGSKMSFELMNNLKKIDVVMGGFPCQSFSNAGKKLGFLDKTRGTLFFDVAKIINEKKPKYVLLENVKHLASHDNGKTWITIRETLRKMGYLVPDKLLILSPHEFGIPQIRWRVFIPAILNDDNLFKQEDIEFNFNENKIKNIKKIKFDKIIDDSTIISDQRILDALFAWGEFIKNVRRPFGRTLPVIWLDYMHNNEVENLHLLPEWKKKYIKDMQNIYKNNYLYIDKWMKEYKVDCWQKRERKLEWQAGKDKFDYKDTYVQLRQSGFRFKTPNIFPTLVAMVQTSIFFDKNIMKWRYLSKDEVRQLQSFPNKFKYNDKDYQTYKQFGNSVNVFIVKKVLSKLFCL